MVVILHKEGQALTIGAFGSIDCKRGVELALPLPLLIEPALLQRHESAAEEQAGVCLELLDNLCIFLLNGKKFFAKFSGIFLYT